MSVRARLRPEGTAPDRPSPTNRAPNFLAPPLMFLRDAPFFSDIARTRPVAFWRLPADEQERGRHQLCEECRRPPRRLELGTLRAGQRGGAQIFGAIGRANINICRTRVGVRADSWKDTCWSESWPFEKGRWAQGVVGQI